MAGINGYGNFNNFNKMRLGGLNNTNKGGKAEEAKQEEQKKETENQITEKFYSGKKLNPGDMNSLLINRGINIGKPKGKEEPEQPEQPSIELMAHGNGSTKFRRYFSKGALVRDIRNGTTDPQLAYYQFTDSDGVTWRDYFIDGQWVTKNMG